MWTGLSVVTQSHRHLHHSICNMADLPRGTIGGVAEQDMPEIKDQTKKALVGAAPGQQERVTR